MFTEGAGDVSRCIVDKKGSRYGEGVQNATGSRCFEWPRHEGATEPGHDAAAQIYRANPSVALVDCMR